MKPSKVAPKIGDVVSDLKYGQIQRCGVVTHILRRPIYAGETVVNIRWEDGRESWVLLRSIHANDERRSGLYLRGPRRDADRCAATQTIRCAQPGARVASRRGSGQCVKAAEHSGEHAF